jgi:hypothetical protein
VEWNYRKIKERKSALLSAEGESGMSGEREKKGVEGRGSVMRRKCDGERGGGQEN